MANAIKQCYRNKLQEKISVWCAKKNDKLLERQDLHKYNPHDRRVINIYYLGANDWKSPHGLVVTCRTDCGMVFNNVETVWPLWARARWRGAGLLIFGCGVTVTVIGYGDGGVVAGIAVFPGSSAAFPPLRVHRYAGNIVWSTQGPVHRDEGAKLAYFANLHVAFLLNFIYEALGGGGK
uniref:Uncharacterized protein n=1 Tax=Glossina austeni TaxID=7395 RepID=A0A1A9VG33_GLOAU